MVLGGDILRDQWQVEMGYSKWVDLGILLGMVVLYRFTFLGIIKVVEKVKPDIEKIMSMRLIKSNKLWRIQTPLQFTHDEVVLTSLSLQFSAMLFIL